MKSWDLIDLGQIREEATTEQNSSRRRARGGERDRKAEKDARAKEKDRNPA